MASPYDPKPDQASSRKAKQHHEATHGRLECRLPNANPYGTIHLVCAGPGFRSEKIVVVTTLLDPIEFTKDDIAEIYFRRWNVELDLRCLKSVMKMEMLRCKTPELVRKEIWTNILAYNLIRTVIAQAATKHDVHPRSISFKGAIQTLEAFQQLIAFTDEHDAPLLMQLYDNLLKAVASHRVANRPGRFEPRKIKRRKRKYPWLVKPRRETKLELLKGVKPK